MNREEIPNDLILEILSRLPSKSIGRFRCVSKLWRSMLHKPYFIKLFLTRSSTRPRLLIGVRQRLGCSFFSAPQPQNHYGKSSSLVVAADFHMKCSKDVSLVMCRYASGLLYFPTMPISYMDKDGAGIICNPTTRQFASLPRLRLLPKLDYGLSGALLGFDPIGGQFKVLSMNNWVDKKVARYILTLGSEEEGWRKIECPFNDVDLNGGVCINGILYYIAYDPEDRLYLIVCFDVRFEKFKFLTLIGGIYEDVEKQEWLKYAYTLRFDNKVVKDYGNLSVVGVTASGEIVLSKYYAYTPFYVLYFNPERNSVLSVEIQGVGEYHDWIAPPAVCAFVDHVEDLQFNIMKATSINPTQQKNRARSTSISSREDHQVRAVTQLGQDRRTFESINNFDALSLLEDD
ncbi:PREDICTED: putative F-box protein At1g31090 [Camelina sativa]|uniref:F-box protein At1g31090 n=1 Tax=Camelina sativa TaxID=90675 RepID=A0ABM0X4P1_CAMSA|nr:PREDICTED: putative F-box protein At1g31090 [Camelina sativa]